MMKFPEKFFPQDLPLPSQALYPKSAASSSTAIGMGEPCPTWERNPPSQEEPVPISNPFYGLEIRL